MWELFSRGMVPYPGMSNGEVVEKVTKGYRLYKPDDCPDDVYEIMLKCWEKNPKDRPTFEVVYKQIYSLWAKLKGPGYEETTVDANSTFVPEENAYQIMTGSQHGENPYQTV